MSELWPREISQFSASQLKILWNDQHESVIDVVAIRRACVCAQCVDEMTRQPLIKAEDIPEDIKPKHLNSVGRYGLSITWDDGHDSGIFTWESLRNM